MQDKKKILIVDDEKQIVALVSLHMDMAGYKVLSAGDGKTALEIAKRERPDLIVLDLMLPKMDGWEVCRHLREAVETKEMPIIMLTARAESEDKLKGFEIGADDYVTKPFSPRELVVRVKRVLARAKVSLAVSKKYTFGDVVIDTSTSSLDFARDGERSRTKRVEGPLSINLENFNVKVKDKEVYLTQKEREILKLFINRPGELLTHEQILDAVWNDNIVEYGNIDVHISHLREKLEKDPASPEMIKTVKGRGYKFEIEGR